MAVGGLGVALAEQDNLPATEKAAHSHEDILALRCANGREDLSRFAITKEGQGLFAILNDQELRGIGLPKCGVGKERAKRFAGYCVGLSAKQPFGGDVH